MTDTTFIIHVWLDVEKMLGVSKQDFMKTVRTAHWVKRRIRLFNTYTLPSLLNQQFQEFQIFLFLGQTFKHLHGEITKHEKLHPIYDYGWQKYIHDIDTDYVNITRIDSDDMFRKDLMNEVTGRMKRTDQRECLVFKNVIQWNIHHKFISDFHLPRSPFCSHTFPKSVYKDWKNFCKQQFMDYKSCPNLGSPGKVCIIRHGANVTFPRIHKDMSSRAYYKEEMRKRNNIIKSRADMIPILAEFGVDERWVR